MKKQNKVAPEQAQNESESKSQSELAKDYPLAGYFASDKRPSAPLGHGITKALAAELGIKQRQ